MNEEEKKAIELLEDIKNNSWTTKYIMSSDSKNAKLLLNLIEKLQKENEYLKEKWDKDTHILRNELDLINANRLDLLQQNKELRKENNRLEEQVEYDKTHIYTPQTIELNFISKSKIEDKIEELKKNLHTVEHYETVGAIHVLQELLDNRK